MHKLARRLAALALLGPVALPAAADHLNPPGLAAPAGYSHVVVAPAGRTVYVAGQMATDASGRLVGGADFGAQAEQVFANLKTALDAAGATFGQVVRLDMYVTDIGQLKALRAARDKYIDAKHAPASTLVEVRRLVRPDALLEIGAVAVVPER